MYVDWKIKAEGDSGVYIRGQPQIQIWDPKNTNVGSGGLYNNKNHPSQPLVIADNPIGEWNTFYIKMLGNQVTVALNGQLVVDNTVLENFWEPGMPIGSSGQIELQNHGNTLWFRNVFIKEIVEAELTTMMEEALPVARTRPKSPRKVLVFTRAADFRHSSIPHGAHVFQRMGESTGAYEAVITEDVTQFAADKLAEYDAVLLCNTTGRWIRPNEADLKKLDPNGNLDVDEAEQQLRQSLLDYVASGHGLVGVHSASDANYEWAEYGELIGGYFNGHPWHEQVGIRVEQPEHPLSQAFGGTQFSVVDEIYQFRDPYSRDNVQVLLSLDTDETDMSKNGIERKDGDFAVAWLKHHGEGRVFYCSLGHREEIYWNPKILQFYLDGLQFALGDLEVTRTDGP